MRCIFWYCTRTPSIDTAAETQVRCTARDAMVTRHKSYFPQEKPSKAFRNTRKTGTALHSSRIYGDVTVRLRREGIARGQKPNRVMSQCRVFHTALGVPLLHQSGAIAERCGAGASSFSDSRREKQNHREARAERSGEEWTRLDWTGPVWTGVERRGAKSDSER